MFPTGAYRWSKRSFGADRIGSPLGERLPLEMLHHEEQRAFVLADVVQRADMRVVESGDRAGLALETRAALEMRRHVGRENLDGDGSIQPGVARLIRREL